MNEYINKFERINESLINEWMNKINEWNWNSSRKENDHLNELKKWTNDSSVNRD